MRTILLCSLLISLIYCNKQPYTAESAQYADWRLDPYTPPLDTLKSWCLISSENLNRVQKSDTLDCDLYYSKGKLYTGWACAILSDNKHKFRYQQYEAGKMVRRIGFYNNGRLDFDFRMKNCENYGPSRMWLYEDGMYIDEFYSEPGIKHGLHKRWYGNGTLAREAQYDNGVLQFEKEYDLTGQLVSEK